MKWLFSTHKAIQHFLKRYHLHGGSRHRFFHASNTIWWSKLDEMRTSCLYHAHYYNTSAIVNANECSHRLQPNSNTIGNDVKKVDLEVVSRETVKPSSPTPHHLRTFNLSLIDQVMLDVYTPFILFFPNTDKASVTDVLTKRSKHLKETLSEILTRFYPVAGKIKDNLRIECNDEGVYYAEALVNQTIEEFLAHPDDERVRGLMPEKPWTEDSSMGNYVIGIQVNIFKCGGIGLSMTASHKFFDAHTYYVFMKAWAAAARGSLETITPCFVASEIFPHNPYFEYSVSSKFLATKPLSTKRFVFDSTALALLKAQPVVSTSSAHPRQPTRVEATSAVIWKAAAQAASKVRPFGPQTPHALLSPVNLRKKASPPLPIEAIGNIVDGAATICFPSGHLNLPTLMGEIRESIAKINIDHIESLKGEKGLETMNESLRRANHLTDMTNEGDCLLATSVLNSGIYDLDFGWGRSIWFYVMNARNTRRVTLNETLKGGGVEAIVTLSPEEMEIFERDLELLSYATVNPSPLRFIHKITCEGK